jgi:hypothetical protein
MGRIRNIKPTFFKDDDLAEFDFYIRYAYAGLWVYADKAGRLEDNKRLLKAEIFPYDDIDMEEILTLLAMEKKSKHLPFILRYKYGRRGFIQIVNWNHQRPHSTEKESLLPPPTEEVLNKYNLKIELYIINSDIEYINNKYGIDIKHNSIGSLSKANSYITVSPQLLQARLEEFWSIYPKRNGRKAGKQECIDFISKNFKTEEELSQLIAATKNYANCKQAKENYAKDPIRFLKKDYWKDWLGTSGKDNLDKSMKLLTDIGFPIGTAQTIATTKSYIEIKNGIEAGGNMPSKDESEFLKNIYKAIRMGLSG